MAPRKPIFSKVLFNNLNDFSSSIAPLIEAEKNCPISLAPKTAATLNPSFLIEPPSESKAPPVCLVPVDRPLSLVLALLISLIAKSSCFLSHSVLIGTIMAI